MLHTNNKKIMKYAIVMAAGKGTRMKSELPKVLHPVLGRPMIEYVLDALEQAEIDKIIVVVGYRSDLVRAHLAPRQNLEFVEQTEQLGAGHAVMACNEVLKQHTGPVMVVAGDMPMIQVDTIHHMFAQYQSENQPSCILGTAHKENSEGFGRIIRNDAGEFHRIVEERDTSPEQKRTTEVNLSYYIFHTPDLLSTLPLLKTDNANNEYYLVDVPAIMKSQGKHVITVKILNPIEALGINTLEEVEIVEEAMKRRSLI